MSDGGNPSLKMGIGGIIQVEVEGGDEDSLAEVSNRAYDSVNRAIQYHRELIEFEDERGDDGNSRMHG